MSTILQKKLAKAVVENLKAKKPKNKKELVASSGYGEVTADRHSKIILEQKGVQEELKKLGFDSDSAKKVVGAILRKGKEENKLKAADMIFKVGGDYAAEKRININVPVPIYAGQSVDSVQGHVSNKKDIPT